MKLVKTSTHRDTVVLTDSEFQSLKQPGAELTVIISQKIGDQYQKIDTIENVDVAYALENYRNGWGLYEGRKIVSVRSFEQPIVLTTSHSYGFREQREKRRLTQKQVIRRTGLSPYEISKLENDKLDLTGLHENTWGKLKLGYGDEFIANVRAQLTDHPPTNV